MLEPKSLYAYICKSNCKKIFIWHGLLGFAFKEFTEKLAVTSDAAALWHLPPSHPTVKCSFSAPPYWEDKLAPSK